MSSRPTLPQALAVVFTFASAKPGAQCLLLTLLSVGFLALHLRVTPMRDLRAQELQSTLLGCLVVVALTGAPFAITLEVAAPSSSGSSSVPAGHMARQLQVGLLLG